MHIKPKNVLQFVIELGVGIGAVLLIVTAANRIPPPNNPLPAAPLPPEAFEQLRNLEHPPVPPEAFEKPIPEWTPSSPSVPAGHTIIEGTVVDRETGEGIRNVTVSIPELGLTTNTGAWSLFTFDIALPNPYPEDGVWITVVTEAKGYGRHRVVDLSLAPRGRIDIAALELTPGTAETVQSAGRPRNWLRGPQNADVKGEEFHPSPDLPLQVPPRYIRIAIRENGPDGRPNPNGRILRVEQVELEYYIKNVLPNEWIWWWHTEALKAGAEAVRQYAWHWVNVGGKYPAIGADLDNSVNSQVYIPGNMTPETNVAVDAIWSDGWKKNGAIFQSFYCAGIPGSPAVTCPFGGMTQHGSQYLATTRGMNYQQILNYYYSTPSSPVEYYVVIPQTPKPLVQNVGLGWTIFGYSTPGARWYQVIKWMNGSWRTVYYGNGSTSYLDYQANGTGNYYSAAAWNGAGWSPWSFNEGHVASAAGTFSTAPPQTAAYPAGNLIRLRYKTPGATSYYVIRWNGSSWVNVYQGDQPEFIDANLAPGTGRYYAVAAYQSGIGWTPYTNFGGYVASVTYQGQ